MSGSAWEQEPARIRAARPRHVVFLGPRRSSTGAMRSLGAALAAAGNPGWPMNRRNFLVLLESGGPFLALDGKLLAHGVLPPLRLLEESIRRALDEKAPSRSGA